MLIKKIGENKYRRATVRESLRHWAKEKEREIYSMGCFVVGAILIVFTVYLILGGV